MEFLYTIDPSAEEPIMLLDAEIGYNEETGTGIPADKFCRELMFLDTIGKSKINIWVNSPGGSVVDGMQIFNTILKTKTKVDTHNVGMAASIAAPIFLAGRNRYMMDNAVLMVHPVSGGDEVSRQVFEKCVNTMISSRGFLTSEVVKGLMDATTWMDAIECESLGLCIRESSSDFNKVRTKPDLSNVLTAHNHYKQITNSAINEKLNNKKSQMKKVYNKLNLVDGTNEDGIVMAIDKIEAENRAGNQKIKDLENELANKKAEYDKLDNELNAMKAKAKADEEARVGNEAKVEIENAVKVGKIKNEAPVIEMWTKNYLANPAGTKAILESMVINKKGADLGTHTNTGNDSELTAVASKKMVELQNKFNL
jgi:ATP-dependent Clp protease protease subunit